MSRTSEPQIRGMFVQVLCAARDAKVDTTGWKADNAPQYGGWCIEYDGGSLGSAFFDANRMKAGAFYQMLRVLRDVFERMAT